MGQKGSFRKRSRADVPGLACACTLRARLRGLLGLDGYEGVLMLAPCRDIHTFGMRFPIDVAFVSEAGEVLEVHRGIMPRRRLRCRKAVAVLERASNENAPWYRKGDRVRLEMNR